MKITLTQNEARYLALKALGLGDEVKYRPGQDLLVTIHEVEITDGTETGLDQGTGQNSGCAEGSCKCTEGSVA